MFVGIDVGGTNLKAGLVDETGQILAVERTPLCFQGPEAFARTLAELTRTVAGRFGVDPQTLEGVGVGLPGAVDGGEVLFTTNIPMEHLPLEVLFRRELDLPLRLGNDADCAAAAEYLCGAGRGTLDFAMVTLGTGVGVGLVIDGKLRSGIASSEGGHMVTHQGGRSCNCGGQGCWEQYASATGLILRTEEAMAQHPESLLHIESLRPKIGLDQDVNDYVFSFQETREYLAKLQDLLGFSLPLYAEEGKTSLTIAVGCTGGHHRSVAVAHALTEFIRQKGYQVSEHHRDIQRGV